MQGATALRQLCCKFHVCLLQGVIPGKKQAHARRDLFGATVEDIW